jgi:hypothetical protein
MDNAMVEKVYQASEESWRLSGATWAKAFDAAQASLDQHLWSIEEAAWATYRSAAVARNLAWELCEHVSGQAREKARREAMERLAQAAQAPVATVAPVSEPVHTNGVSRPIASASAAAAPAEPIQATAPGVADTQAIPTFRLDTLE